MPGGASSKDAVDIDQRGHYQIERAGLFASFGGGLLDEAESLLDSSGPAASAKPVAQGHPVAFWLLILAIFLLVSESLLYHRRKAG
jgi:hypothetical protein